MGLFIIKLGLSEGLCPRITIYEIYLMPISSLHFITNLKIMDDQLEKCWHRFAFVCDGWCSWQCTRVSFKTQRKCFIYEHSQTFQSKKNMNIFKQKDQEIPWRQFSCKASANTPLHSGNPMCFIWYTFTQHTTTTTKL